MRAAALAGPHSHPGLAVCSSHRAHRILRHRLNSTGNSTATSDVLIPNQLYQKDEADIHSFVGAVQAVRLAG